MKTTSDEPGPLMYVEAKLRGLSTNFLVDCGSTSTIISLSLWEQIRQPSEELADTQKGIGVAKEDTVLTISGRVAQPIPIYLGDLKTKFLISPLVSPDLSEECLLGQDFLWKYGCDMLMSKAALKIQGYLVPLSAEQPFATLPCVKVAMTTTIPANHEMIIPAQVEGQHNHASHGP